MNPTRVSAENYRTYERLDVALPTGCTAIIGPNGAGKSSIVNLVELALFGPANRQMAPLLTEGCTDELMIGLEFEHRGEMYRIRRRYSPTGRGKTTLDFETEHELVNPLDPQRWVPLTATSMTETQNLIDATLGLSRDTFRASSFLAQGDGAAFTEALPARRKEILGEVLGLGIWDELLERAKRRLAEVVRMDEAARTERLRAQETALEGHSLDVILRADRDTLTTTSERLTMIEERLEAALARHADAREAVARTDGAKATLRAAETLLVGLQQQDEASKAAAVELVEHDEPIRAAREAAEPLGALELALEVEKERVDGHRLKLAEHRQALDAQSRAADQEAQTQEFRAKVIARLEEVESGEVSFCGECGRPLEDEHKAKVLADLREELARYDEKLPEQAAEVRALGEAIPPHPGDPPTRERLDELAGEVGGARLAARDLAILEERVRNLESRAGGGPKPEQLVVAHEAVLAASAEVRHLAELTKGVNLMELQEHGAALKQELSQLAATKSQLETAIARNEERMLQVKQAEETITASEKQLALLAEQHVVLELAVRAYSRDGVPALIVESVAVPQIEVEASRILEALATPYMVELRTQKESKSSGSVSESLDIIIHTAGGERPYETFSGGERTRLNLSLRIALARLLAHRRGAEVRLLAIDEPEFLDDDGVEQLALVLNGLASDFDRIILISHMPALRESFPQALVVSKDGERSIVGEQAGVAA